MSALAQIGRIAFREEGENWNAYFAPPSTMEGAIYLGSLRMSLAQSPKLKKAFMQLMRDAFDVHSKQIFGTKAAWKEPVVAPDHERTRKA